MLLFSLRFLAVIAALCLPLLVAAWQIKGHRNLRVSEPGVLYRSGQFDVRGLKQVIHDHGIRTVITLREKTSERTAKIIQEEEDYCKRQGIYYFALPILGWETKPGQGEAPAMENVREVLRILDDPKHHPVLIHCFAGIHRTGMYCAVCRLERQGWDVDRAVAEMRHCGYIQYDEHTDVQGFLQNYKPKRK